MKIREDQSRLCRASIFEQYQSLQPTFRAHALGFASTIIPRLLPLYLALARGKLSLKSSLEQSFEHAKSQLRVEKIPAACAILVFAATWIPQHVLRLISAVARNRRLSIARTARIQAVITFISTFIAGLVSFALLKRRQSRVEHQVKTDCTKGASDVNNQLEVASPYTVPHRAERDFSGKSSKHDTDVSKPDLQKASRTIDTTIFIACRASDILFITLWRRLTSHYKSTKSRPSTLATRLIHILERIATPTVFSISSAIIMWSWFYSPDTLPRSYNAWISSAAQIDTRLIQVLRECRLGTFVYGRKQTDENVKHLKIASSKDHDRSPPLHDPPTPSPPPLLAGLAKDLSLPPSWGDPSLTIPIPCELYHSGAGPSCEWHALTRFARGWVFAMKMYLPLHLLGLLFRLRSRYRNRRHRSLPNNNTPTLDLKPTSSSSTTTSLLSHIAQTTLNATRSSTFLATFISLFYYGVCLTRTRGGPFLLPFFRPQEFRTQTQSRTQQPRPLHQKTGTKTPTHPPSSSSISTAQHQAQAQYLESGPAILTGCLLCGWSILLEKASRWEEIMAFVVPRAVGVLLSKGSGEKQREEKQYLHPHPQLERLTFATSVALVLSAARTPSMARNVRGVFGRVVGRVLLGS